jgi:hypothetical protein
MVAGEAGWQADVRSAACPGGMARQYRVQVQDAQLPDRWRLVGSFRDMGSAESCARRAESSGDVARIVDCQALPTAA